MLDPTTVTIISVSIISFGVGSAFGGAITRWLVKAEAELTRSGKVQSWTPKKKWALTSILAVAVLVAILEILVTF